jgi:integrase
MGWEDFTFDVRPASQEEKPYHFVAYNITKTGKPDIVFFHDNLREFLRPIQKKNGKIIHLTKAQIRHYWDRVCVEMKAALGKKITWHGMRHTFITNMLRKGVDILTVKAQARHARLETTLRYLHTSDKQKIAASKLAYFEKIDTNLDTTKSHKRRQSKKKSPKI